MKPMTLAAPDQHEYANAPHLLMVDDDQVDAMALERALRRAGVTSPILRAQNGREGLETLRSSEDRRGFVVVLDLHMPVMTGFEFLRELRQDPTHANTVVFVLSNSEFPPDRIAAYNHHVAGYVPKRDASDWEELAGLLSTYLRVTDVPRLDAGARRHRPKLDGVAGRPKAKITQATLAARPTRPQ
ncbi:MAG: response regulator [Pseudomonadota bacterium]